MAEVTCPKCQLVYDDTYRVTICPHDTFDMHCGVVVDGVRGCAHTLEELDRATSGDNRVLPNVNCPLNVAVTEYAKSMTERRV